MYRETFKSNLGKLNTSLLIYCYCDSLNIGPQISAWKQQLFIYRTKMLSYLLAMAFWRFPLNIKWSARYYFHPRKHLLPCAKMVELLQMCKGTWPLPQSLWSHNSLTILLKGVPGGCPPAFELLPVDRGGICALSYSFNLECLLTPSNQFSIDKLQVPLLEHCVSAILSSLTCELQKQNWLFFLSHFLENKNRSLQEVHF